MATCPDCGAERPPDAAACPRCGRPAPNLEHDHSEVQTFNFPLTKWIIGLNVAVYAAMTLRGVSPTTPTVDQLQRWGADYGPLVFAGQWWRLLTNVFVHIGIVHLALNMWALWNVGALAERIYGRAIYLYLYVFSGIAGSLASLAWHPNVTGAGASGAIFGVAGALIITFHWGDLQAPRETVRPILRSLVIFAAYNLFYGAIKTGIDNSAHLGGFAGGILIAAALNWPPMRRAEASAHRRTAAVAGSLLLVALAVWLGRANEWRVHEQRAALALQKGNTQQAVSELELVAQRKPRDADVQALLGATYLANRQNDRAEAALQRAVDLAPTSSEHWRQLALFYLQTQRMQKALDTYQRALQRIPTWVEGWNELGQLYLAGKRTQEALQALGHAVELAPSNPAIQINWGRALATANRLPEAEKAYQRAVELQPNFAQAYFNLGNLYLQEKEYDKAITSFQKVAQLAPTIPEPQLGLASAYNAKGMHNEATAALQKAAQLRAAQMKAAAAAQAAQSQPAKNPSPAPAQHPKQP